MTRWIRCSSFVRHISFAIGFLVGLAFTPASSLSAQTANRTADELTSISMGVFTPKHIAAEDAKKKLQTLIGETTDLVSIGIDGSRKMIIHAPSHQLEVIKDVLRALDQAAREKTGVGEIKIIPLVHADASTAAVSLKELVPDAGVAVDQRTNSVVVNGNAAEVLTIEAILARLDAPEQRPVQAATSYQIEMFWLVESDGEEVDPDGAAQRKPDSRLEEAIAELKTQGFQELRQCGQARVAAKSGASFTLSSSNSLGQLEASGMLSLSKQDDQQIALMLQLTTQSAFEGFGATANVQTEIITQPGHNVVLGIAGATGDDRRSAFVVRVER